MGFKPKFLKTFANLGQDIKRNSTVHRGSQGRIFPGAEHSFKSKQRLRVVGKNPSDSQDDNLILYGNID